MRTIPASVIACLAVMALAVTGCGGDDENSSPQARTAPSTAGETEQTQSAAAPTEATETTETTESSMTATSPEEQPGGAGDEEAAHSQALFTGRGGRVKPVVIRVPAYIAIRDRAPLGGRRRLRPPLRKPHPAGRSDDELGVRELLGPATGQGAQR